MGEGRKDGRRREGGVVCWGGEDGGGEERGKEEGKRCSVLGRRGRRRVGNGKGGGMEV